MIFAKGWREEAMESYLLIGIIFQLSKINKLWRSAV